MSVLWRVREEGERRPLSERTVARLRSLIRDGVWNPGEQLPSEPELTRQLGVSRATVRAAIAELAAELLVERRRGVGTFVRRSVPVLSHGLERLIGTAQSIELLGMEAGDLDLVVEHVPAPAELADRFDVAVDIPLVHVRRTRTADGRPVLHCEEWIPEDVLPSRTAVDDLHAGESLYGRLEHLGVAITEAVAKVIPVRAGTILGARLGIDAATPILLLRQTHYSAGAAERPVMFTENFYNSELIELHAIRRR
ncbi:MAG: GntR family transcriptional regulator [Euzebyales bacterium]|nr:GntR family transcriptional regulator [Euzebyales bacterium]MBA3621721.1 GntR family transcriptional regulator [Euzebyales bacterium]